MLALAPGERVGRPEVKIETFDGLHKVIRNTAAPIFDDAGRIVGGLAVNEDITLLKHAEATRDLFVGILGHDLRSPLNAITMSAAHLLRRGGLTVPQTGSVTRIQSSGARIQHLIDGLLDFTRARFGTAFSINPVMADMGAITASIVDEVRAAHPERAIQFQRHGSLRGVWDPGRVAQVVSNLVGNAVQHGGDPIAVDARDAGDAVILSVSNRGAAISESKVASLFEPFQKSAGSEGIGLGLYIARELVGAHHGTIDVASTEGATTFTTRWPR